MQWVVTQHAYDRWLQRSASYGDDHGGNLIRVAREARVVGLDEYLPVARVVGHEYRLCPQGATIFVCQRRNRDEIAIVTVLTYRERARTPPPARKPAVLELQYLHPKRGWVCVCKGARFSSQQVQQDECVKARNTLLRSVPDAVTRIVAVE